MRNLLNILMLTCAIVIGDVAIAGVQVNLNCFKSKYRFPALGVATVDGNRVESAVSGTRIAGDSTPVGSDDKWHLGSVSKSFTALLVATLVNERKMTWRTTGGELFQEIRLHPHDSGSLSMASRLKVNRDINNQSAGLSRRSEEI